MSKEDLKKTFYKIIEAMDDPSSSFLAVYCLCKTPGLNLHGSCLSPLRAICQCDCHQEDTNE